MVRRDFLRLAISAALVAGVPRLQAAQPAVGRWDRSLVLVELGGGNDGLNTVVPYADRQYHALRPGIGISRDQALQLDERTALHPSLEPLMGHWRDGELAIVQGVGYPRPNRSHFRSIDIWETGSDSDQYLESGWLARLFASAPPPGDRVAEGIVIGQGNAGALTGEAMRTIVMRDPRRFVRQARGVQDSGARAGNPALAHILAVQKDTERAAASLEEQLRRGTRLATSFPKSPLGRELEQAAELLVGGTGAPVIKVSHGGFDTHSGQAGRHERLMTQLAEGLSAFREAMQAAGLWERVLVMTYSEFGRRVAENASKGTDHGTAAPHLLLGGRVRGGLYGRQPSLTDLDGGDLRHAVDFRSLYSTAAEAWWELPRDRNPFRTHRSINCIA